jgi:hypothetical protein
LISILNGSVSPQEIVFNIPYLSSKGEEYIIPDWLKKLTSTYPILKINRCETDYGPATKIIPTLLKYQFDDDQKIVYIDDDIIYHRDFLKNFIRDSEKIDQPITRSGYKVSYFLNKKSLNFFKYRYILLTILFLILSFFTIKKFGLNKYLLFTLMILIILFIYQFSIRKSDTDILMGYSGVLIKPKYFDIQKLINYSSYPKEVFYQDDIYLSGNIRENGYKSIKIKDGGVNVSNFKSILGDNLGLTHNFDEKNRIISIKSFNWNLK